MKNPFTNENSNLSHIFHNNIHRKKVESLKVRSTEEFLCQFSLLPCRFFRGRRQGRQPLNNIQIQSYTCILYIQYIYIYHSHVILYFLFVWRNSNPLIKSSTFHTQWLAIWGGGQATLWSSNLAVEHIPLIQMIFKLEHPFYGWCSIAVFEYRRVLHNHGPSRVGKNHRLHNCHNIQVESSRQEGARCLWTVLEALL